jgi:hypothetical protein
VQVYSELVGNTAIDGASAKKYYMFRESSPPPLSSPAGPTSITGLTYALICVSRGRGSERQAIMDITTTTTIITITITIKLPKSDVSLYCCQCV